MQCKEVIEKLEEQWSKEYAMEWDNVGLLIGRQQKSIKKIFVALDVNEDTIDQALKFGADLIITHHPLLFSPIKKITDDTFMGARLIKMIQNDLCYYAMHTNFDVKGMGILNQEILGLEDTSVLQITAFQEGREEGIGRVGFLPQEMTLQEFAKTVKSDFQIPDVRLYGKKEDVIRKVAISSGSGKSMVEIAIQQQVQVLVTGDIDYHTAMDALAQGLYIIDAGHYGTEFCFIAYMKEKLSTMFPAVEVEAAKVCHPYEVI